MAEIKSALDIVLALVAILLGLAVIIAVLGIVNTLALSVVERTRELGLLRAVGMSRRQLRAMIRWESVNIALIGGVLGVAVGMQIGVTISNSLGDVITVGHVPVGSARHVRGVRRAGGCGSRRAPRPPGGPPRRARRGEPRVAAVLGYRSTAGTPRRRFASRMPVSHAPSTVLAPVRAVASPANSTRPCGAASASGRRSWPGSTPDGPE